MDLILWRHAEAEDAEPDLARNLTDKGRRQARLMAHWLHGYLPDGLRILCSPANRTRQTADALQLPYEIHGDIAPDHPVSDLLKATGWPDAGGTVMLVGHNPSISELASKLLAGRTFPMSLCKGGAIWLGSDTEEGAPGVIVKAAMVPAMLEDVSLSPHQPSARR